MIKCSLNSDVRKVLRFFLALSLFLLRGLCIAEIMNNLLKNTKI